MNSSGFTIEKVLSGQSLNQYLVDYRNSTDRYLTSPNYYLLTGRKGLYIFKMDDSYLLFCNHPNECNSLLVFPLVNHNQVQTLFFLVKQFSKSKKIQVVRFQSKNLLLYHHASLTVQEVSEEILDWKYPSIEISTSRVNNLQGREFRDLRYNISKVDIAEARLARFYPDRDMDDSLELVKKWCSRHASEQYSFEDLFGLYQEILVNYDAMNGIAGFVLYYYNKLVAFNFLEKPLFAEGEMVSLAFIADADVKGIPSFMRYAVCKMLGSTINKITVGGSETYGLYRFKKKLNPINEIELKTLEVGLNPRSI